MASPVSSLDTELMVYSLRSKIKIKLISILYIKIIEELSTLYKVVDHFADPISNSQYHIEYGVQPRPKYVSPS